ncbi:hypothetical protein [Sessilibacter corallicola]|uniref:hypothetical protein n=1 Tax=Sessilibacter corallicola TaxID=2904075 RepID=UPI001E5B8CDC|nr:hypothetical protein [Sessilibacter corallicola]MCE2029261.1 hypothetical protein [Sessilibacter corallicola]
MKIQEKRKAGEILGRGGIAQRIIQIANEISSGTYKGAIIGAGRIAELVDSASYDKYWAEKSKLGRQLEKDVLSGLIEGDVSRDTAISRVRPTEI